MRKPRFRTVRATSALAAVALIGFAACSSGGTQVRQPAPVRNYGPEAGGTAQAVQQPAAPVASGSFGWNNRLASAQDQARAGGKLILVTSTKPGCTLCEKFKNQIVPAVAGEAGRMCVGYVYDITRPEVRQIDQILRANLDGASLMPLVGFVTPDLRWVHGFWGARTVEQFRGDIAAASRGNPLRSASLGPMDTVGAPRSAAASSAMASNGMTSVVNEFGETEWARPSDVWPGGSPADDPEPIDAITGTPGVPDPNAMDSSVPFGAPDSVPMVADNAIPPTALPPAPPTPPSAAPAAGTGEGPLGVALPPVPVTDPIAEAPTTAPAATVPDEPRWSEPLPASAASSALDSPEAWGRQALDLALSQIQGARFDAARSTLAEVRRRLPDTTLARESSKGDIALYNAKRMLTAPNAAERDRFLTRARRDLGDSMWGVLFS